MPSHPSPRRRMATMAENSVEAIEQRLDEHDADARSWLNTITPTDVRLLLSELAAVKAENERMRELFQKLNGTDLQYNELQRIVAEALSRPSPQATPKHEWVMVEGHAYYGSCSVCGVIRRADDTNKPCPGKAPRISVREPQATPRPVDFSGCPDIRTPEEQIASKDERWKPQTAAWKECECGGKFRPDIMGETCVFCGAPKSDGRGEGA